MLVRRVIVRRVEMPLKFRFRTSFGEWTAKRYLLVELDGGDLAGFGECVAEEAPLYSPETLGTAHHLLKEFLVPRLFEEPSQGPEEFFRRVQPIRGHRMAKAAVEIALWDLRAKERAVPLSQALGGVRSRVDVGVSLGLQATLEALVDLVRAHVDKGYKRIKLKIEPGRDVELLRAVREAFPGIVLTVDANAAYTLEDVPALTALDAYGLDYIEQPLHHEDLWGHSRLAKMIKTPICLDESIRSAADAEAAIALGAAQVINIKVGRVGGLGEARRVHDVAQAAGVPVWCGGMLEAGVGRAVNVHLASLPGFTKPGDTSSASRYFDVDVVEPMLEAERGEMPVPTGPGIGVTVRYDVLRRYTTAEEVLAP